LQHSFTQSGEVRSIFEPFLQYQLINTNNIEECQSNQDCYYQCGTHYVGGTEVFDDCFCCNYGFCCNVEVFEGSANMHYGNTWIENK